MAENPTQNISKLSIYPEKEDVPVCIGQAFKSTIKSPTHSFGVTAINLVSEVKEKYNNTIRNIERFKQYATSVEGKVKFSVMFVGLSGGLFLAYRSKSANRYYKGLMPVGTLTLAASACYPYTAYEVSKKIATTTYFGSIAMYNGSKHAYTYVHDKLKTFESKDPQPEAVEEKETTYSIDERGIADVTSEASNDPSIAQHDNNKPTTTLLQLLPSDLKPTEKDETVTIPPGDLGQSSPEDSDLYTTRS